MKNIQSIIIVILTGIIIWLSQCQRVDVVEPVQNEVEYVHDTTYVPQLVYEDTTIYSISYRDTAIYDTTSAIVQYISPEKDWMTQRQYMDTLDLDTLGYLVLHDLIYKNKIVMRSYSAHIKFKMTPPVKLKSRSVTEIYWGGSTTLSPTGFKSLTGDLLLTRNDAGYLIGIGLGQDFNYVFKFGIYFKF